MSAVQGRSRMTGGRPHRGRSSRQSEGDPRMYSSMVDAHVASQATLSDRHGRRRLRAKLLVALCLAAPGALFPAAAWANPPGYNGRECLLARQFAAVGRQPEAERWTRACLAKGGSVVAPGRTAPVPTAR